MIRDFIEVLDLMYQHPEMKLADLLASDAFTVSRTLSSVLKIASAAAFWTPRNVCHPEV